MGRKRKAGGFRNPNQIQEELGNGYYDHYYTYLSALAYQLFEWKNLPDSIDPRYLEISLHMFGFVGFYNDPTQGFIASQGAPSGTVNHYLLPDTFQANAPTYQKTFKVFNYSNVKEDDMGVIIWNNDYHFSTLPSIQMFARDLAETKEIIRVNMNAQKTPVTIATDEETKFSMLQVYNQYEGNAPVIVHHNELNPDNIKVMKTDAPYVVDKLNTQRNAIWNEIMTYFGVENANQEKRERMITAEAESNSDQVINSGNIFLKARKEACSKINELYGTNIEVDYRADAVKELQRMAMREEQQRTDTQGGEGNE